MRRALEVCGRAGLVIAPKTTSLFSPASNYLSALTARCRRCKELSTITTRPASSSVAKWLSTGSSSRMFVLRYKLRLGQSDKPMLKSYNISWLTFDLKFPSYRSTDGNYSHKTAIK